MKVLAFNGSPRGEKSCTNKILTSLFLGMELAGAETEVLHLAEYNIKHCTGCFCCWTKTPGKCVIKDDMVLLLDKYLGADIIIYGTPLYVYTMTGLMKDFMDRKLPLALPDVEENKDLDGVTRHVARNSTKNKKILLVSPCGFPELSHFEPLVFTFKRMAKMTGAKYLGEILRPTAEALRIPEHQKELEPYYDLLKIAGKQLIEQEKIDNEVLSGLHTPWVSVEEFRRNMNEKFQKEIAKTK